jgi:hypothetical protein
LIPVWPAAIGLKDGDTTFPISYTVSTFDGLFGSPQDALLDSTPAVSFDVANPRVQVSSPLFADLGGTAIPYRLGSSAGSSVSSSPATVAPDAVAAAAADVSSASTSNGRPGHDHQAPAKALLLHLHAKSGHRAEVLTLRG